jgi:hypothetical protein
MLKIVCGEKGYMLEIDGIESPAHIYGHACITGGPSGTLYAACPMKEPGPTDKVQLYKLTPVDCLVEKGVELEEDVEGGYVEDAMYEDEDEGEDEDEEAGAEVEVEAETEDEDDDDDDEDDDEDGGVVTTPA